MISLAHCYKLVLIKEQTHVSLALKLNCFSIYLYIALLSPGDYIVYKCPQPYSPLKLKNKIPSIELDTPDLV